MACNWGILGPGFVATRAVMPAMRQIRDARLLAVASRDEGRARLTAARFGIERAYDDYQSLLNDADVEAVYIALPNHLHGMWTIRAAEAGKHVLCEKPLAMNAGECDEMIAACRRAKVLLMEAVMYRFHPRMVRLKQMVSGGELGEVRLLHSAFCFAFDFGRRDDFRVHAELGGGAVLDVGSYCVNAVRWLVGGEPRRVQAEVVYGAGGVDVGAGAVLRFEGDVLADVQCSFVAAERQVIEVVGSVGGVRAERAFTAWRGERTELVVERGGRCERVEFPAADPYEAMVGHFTDCVLGRAGLRYPAEDGRATLRVLDNLRLVGRRS